MSIFTQTRLSAHISLIISGLGTIAAAYALYRLLQRYLDDEDSYCPNQQTKSLQGGATHRRVLVLGLVGAGKTRLLQCFRQQNDTDGELDTPAATLGYNIASSRMGGIDYHFFEGGCTSYWDLDADVLVWVVDSSCPDAFQASQIALHRCVEGLDKSYMDESKSESSAYALSIPIIIVASKQDLEGCVKPDVVFANMKVDALRPQHKIYIVGTQIPNKGERKGLWRLYELVAFAERKRCTSTSRADMCIEDGVENV